MSLRWAAAAVVCVVASLVTCGFSGEPDWQTEKRIVSRPTVVRTTPERPVRRMSIVRLA